MLKVKVGCSIKNLLCLQLNLSSEYVSKTISTIFLDGSPVDDIDSSTVEDGSTIALSGSMPGLAGAAMRSGNFYASFRDSIKYKKIGSNRQIKEGLICLKLFNIVMKELGYRFLRNGILVKSSNFLSFMRSQFDDFGQISKNILLNGVPIDLRLLDDQQFILQSELVFLKVKTIKEIK